jgi:cytochrome b561
MAMLRNTADRYGLVARMFHAAVAATILANLALGLLFDDAVETGEGRFAALHATLGIATLLLLFARLVWRAFDRPPALLGTPLEQRMAQAGHLGLYALALMVALSGWLYASSEHARIDLLGGAELPALNIATEPTQVVAAPVGDDDEDDGDAFWEEVHELGSWALLALIALHAAAALMHRRRKDGVWERMFG